MLGDGTGTFAGVVIEKSIGDEREKITQRR
jgi:hypothetical protein